MSNLKRNRYFLCWPISTLIKYIRVNLYRANYKLIITRALYRFKKRTNYIILSITCKYNTRIY